MSSSAEHVRIVAERLCDAAVQTVEAVSGGGNSRVYRVETAAATYALKVYPAPAGDGRDRLGTEVAALRFLHRHVPAWVPQPLAVDVDAGCALYDWVAGEPAAPRSAADLDALAAFAADVHALRHDPEAPAFARASEAIIGSGDLLAQLGSRLGRLHALAPDEPDLRRLLTERVEPQLARHGRLESRFSLLPPDDRTLSPSDFGLHNALRRSDGAVVFIDFEYFGWDDPVKLVADVLWHPGMALTRDERDRVHAALARVYAGDPAFGDRLRAYEPLIGLRWVAIVLNEFVPEVWQRRLHAGHAADWAAAKRRQLAKAHALLDRLEGSDA